MLSIIGLRCLSEVLNRDTDWCARGAHRDCRSTLNNSLGCESVVATGSIEAGIIQATYNYWQLLEDLTMEQTPNYRRYKILLLVLTGVVFIWGAIGALDITRIPYAGYTLSPDGGRVTLVRAGSPAEQAGIKVGDTVTRINGIPISDFAALTERGRPAIDSEGSLTVKRDASGQTLTFKYAQQPLVDVMTGPG